MKKLLILSLISASLANLVSCKKDQSYTSPYDQNLSKNAGTLAAKVNGIDWPFSQRSINFTYVDDPTDSTFSVLTKLYDDAGLRYQSLTIGSISRLIKTDNPITTLKFVTNSGSSKYSHPYVSFGIGVDDADEGMWDILPDSTGKNAITVTSYDPNAKHVIGTFQFTMVRSYGHPQGTPDTLNFTDGVFDLKINETP